METVFPVRYGLQQFTEVQRMHDSHLRVVAGSNTSTVSLRVVGGDEKGTQCLGV
jgi:hypothetical protein